MQRDPKHTLDYSSPAEEQRRERAAADERREGIERHNEWAFGERRPFASILPDVVITFAIAAVPFFFLPRRTAYLVALVLVVVLTALRPWRRWW